MYTVHFFINYIIPEILFTGYIEAQTKKSTTRHYDLIIVDISKLKNDNAATSQCACNISSTSKSWNGW